MKLKILGILGAVLLSSCAAPHVQLPSSEPVRKTVIGAQNTTREAQTKISEAQSSAVGAQAKVKSAQKTIAKLQTQVKENKNALTLAGELSTQVDLLSEDLLHIQDALKISQEKLTNTQGGLKMAVGQIGTLQQEINKKQSLIDRATQTEKKYHKLKYGVCFLAAGAVAVIAGLLVFQFWAVLAPLGMVGLGIAGGAIVGLPAIVFIYLMFKL